MKVVALLLFLTLTKLSHQQGISPEFTCNDRLDVVLVVDRSSSLSGSFAFITNAVSDFVTEITTNNLNIRIGLIYYDDTTTELEITGNAASLQNFITNQVGSTGGGTRTNVGIRNAVAMLGRRADTTVPGSIVVITDAISQQPTETAREAALARDAGYLMFAVGIFVNDNFAQELMAITDDAGRLFREFTFEDLPLRVVELGKSICAYTVCSGCMVDYGSRRAPHPTRCDKFYYCERRDNENMRAYEKNCGVGTLWHRRFLTCVPSWMALADTTAGCNYCQNTQSTYSVGDHCEIYYTCGVDEFQRQTLNVNCCPQGMSYSTVTGGCEASTTCSPQNYEDKRSCRGYYQCRGVATRVWTRDCCNGEYYNATARACEANSNCIGTCQDATVRPCGFLRPHPTDRCKFMVQFAQTSIEMRCAGLSSFQQSVCQCVFDPSCPPTEPPTQCLPDVLVPVTTNQNAVWGFSETSENQRWINGLRLAYSDGTIVLGMLNFLSVPYYASNDNAFKENTAFFRIDVRDNYVGGAPSNNRMVVLTNRPCGASFSEAGTRASIWIYMTPRTGQVVFGVRTVAGEATVTVNYVPRDAWKELTLRYTQDPGLLEADIKVYTYNAGVRSVIEEDTQSNSAISGRILTSSCALRIGQGETLLDSFIGLVDNIVFYDDCKSSVPGVNADDPAGLGI